MCNANTNNFRIIYPFNLETSLFLKISTSNFIYLFLIITHIICTVARFITLATFCLFISYCYGHMHKYALQKYWQFQCFLDIITKNNNLFHNWFLSLFCILYCAQYCVGSEMLEYILVAVVSSIMIYRWGDYRCGRLYKALLLYFPTIITVGTKTIVCFTIQ